VDDQASLRETAVDELGPVLDPFEREADGACQFIEADRDEVGQRAPLDQRPDALRGVDLRGILGQRHQGQPVVFGGELGDPSSQ
jgi:hypothetical protein